MLRAPDTRTLAPFAGRRPARGTAGGVDGAQDATEIAGDSEILTLSGTLSPDGPHLHACVADAQGRVLGGHVLPGCVVRTTAELLIAWLDGWAFAREHDATTGYAELVARRIS